MKIILVFVATLDGKITKWGNPMVRTWSSAEDQRYFTAVMKSARLVVMGSNTFNADPIKPQPDRLMVIMTKNPDKYKNYEVPGQIEITKMSPSELTDHYKKKGFDSMFVFGGPHVGTSFFREHLIDEVWLTVEPRIFGTGANFVTDEKLDIQLRLLSSESVNQQGTLINKYSVIK